MTEIIFRIEGEKIIEIIEKLNEEIYDNGGDEEFTYFDFRTNGTSAIINFMGNYQMWHSDEDEREYNDDKDEYESLEQYLRREAKEIINQISSIKLL